MVSLIEFSGGAGAQTALEVNRDAWLLGDMNLLVLRRLETRRSTPIPAISPGGVRGRRVWATGGGLVTGRTTGRDNYA